MNSLPFLAIATGLAKGRAEKRAKMEEEEKERQKQRREDEYRILGLLASSLGSEFYLRPGDQQPADYEEAMREQVPGDETVTNETILERAAKLASQPRPEPGVSWYGTYEMGGRQFHVGRRPKEDEFERKVRILLSQYPDLSRARAEYIAAGFHDPEDQTNLEQRAAALAKLKNIPLDEARARILVGDILETEDRLALNRENLASLREQRELSSELRREQELEREMTGWALEYLRRKMPRGSVVKHMRALYPTVSEGDLLRIVNEAEMLLEDIARRAASGGWGDFLLRALSQGDLGGSTGKPEK